MINSYHISTKALKHDSYGVMRLQPRCAIFLSLWVTWKKRLKETIKSEKKTVQSLVSSEQAWINFWVIANTSYRQNYVHNNRWSIWVRMQVRTCFKTESNLPAWIFMYIYNRQDSKLCPQDSALSHRRSFIYRGDQTSSTTQQTLTNYLWTNPHAGHKLFSSKRNGISNNE